MTRIAASPPPMWKEIISANLPAIEPLLPELIADLRKLDEMLLAGDWEALTAFLQAGNHGREELVRRRWANER